MFNVDFEVDVNVDEKKKEKKVSSSIEKIGDNGVDGERENDSFPEIDTDPADFFNSVSKGIKTEQNGSRFIEIGSENNEKKELWGGDVSIFACLRFETFGSQI